MPLDYHTDTDVKWYQPKNKEFAAWSTSIRDTVCERIFAFPLLSTFPFQKFETHYEISNPTTGISIELWGPGEDIFQDNFYRLPMKNGTPHITPGWGLCDGPCSWKELLQNSIALKMFCHEIFDILADESPFPP